MPTKALTSGSRKRTRTRSDCIPRPFRLVSPTNASTSSDRTNANGSGTTDSRFSIEPNAWTKEEVRKSGKRANRNQLEVLGTRNYTSIHFAIFSGDRAGVVQW